jgi:DNA-binding XRE family transcriptional regulator
MEKIHNFKDLLQDELKDPEFKKEFESLEGEFHLAKEVMMLRKARNLSQKQLAEIAGTSQPAIARLESGGYSNYEGPLKTSKNCKNR